MKRIWNFLFSGTATLVLLLVLGTVLGVATFIEESYDTITAKAWVYNAKWFELLLLLLAVNFIGMIPKYKMLSRKKWAGLLFHLAFAVMILGASLTRYVGFEGNMHIREGESSSVMSSEDPYLQLELTDGSNTERYDREMYFSRALNNHFDIDLELEVKAPVNVTYKNYVNIEEGGGVPQLTVYVSQGGNRREISVQGAAGFEARFVEVPLDGMTLRIAYGEKAIQLPFSLYLNDFILDRYPGSMSPSSYASEVTLIDESRNLREQHRVFMNNVLDYRGYRFFQSSYDRDELGTVLSVNHDRLGTWVSYLGYFLLGLGMVIQLFNPHSRFRAVIGYIGEIQKLRKAGRMTLFALLLIPFPALMAQSPDFRKPVSKEHADRFGQLVVQTYDGRFQPVHTLAIDVMHKISRKDKFDAPGKGSMSDVQVFLDMLMDPNYWQNQPMIYIRDKSVRQVLGVDGKYATLLDFFDEQRQYRLADYAEKSFRKKASEHNSFDKEIIRLDERVNVFINHMNGADLKLFPLPGSPTHQWLNPTENQSFAALSGELAMLQPVLGLEQMTYNNLYRLYLQRAGEAAVSGDYSGADQVIGIIESQQRKETPADLLPSSRKIALESFYNNANIFVQLRNWYSILSVVLLLLAFLENLLVKKNRFVNVALTISIALLALAFLYHTFGMGLRWYLAGHAPWSNGYEALLLVAWGGLLAGFSFLRYSRIPIAATALLAFSMLMTASHSSYDPQLTNLQPVLKSYWLIIHVALITISYGFLGLGFVLGLINLFIMVFKNPKNRQRLELIIREQSYINELNLTVGIVLAVAGTFLGGVWANESWGRYWGWDAKETWALIIVIAYAIILHFRLVPKMKGLFAFNAGSVFAFGTVIMTFVGVNYYLSKGLHSYAADDTPVFPLWAWIMILAIVALSIVAGIREKRSYAP